MTKIKLSYNFGTGKCDFSDGSREEDDFLQNHEGKEIVDWFKEFLEYLVNSYNDDISLDFKGVRCDCETAQYILNEYKNETTNKVTIDLKTFPEENSVSCAEKIKKLKELFEELKSENCPYSEIRDNKNIEEAFYNALGKEFEIAVIATMSSGKSTLINAMIGTELLPARNEATTATIAKIFDDDTANHFCGECFDADGNRIGDKWDPIKKEDIEFMNNGFKNNDEYTARENNVSEIHICGNIVGVSSDGLKLVLVDTPGPNNSSNEEHGRTTYKFITDSKYKPIVLYVLNATQLETMDDSRTLNVIKEAMEKGGRQASDRFIFVMNKADEFDPEKNELIENKIEEVKHYLERKGIKNPKIFPCSAYLAKLLREKDSDLTKKEIRDRYSAYDLIDDPNLHMSNFAPVSTSIKMKLQHKLNEAKKNENRAEQALIHTGVPAIESAISEYLEKYARPYKIREAVSSFLETINQLGAKDKEISNIENNEKRVNELKNVIEKIQYEIQKGEKGKAVKEKIDSLSTQDKIKEKIEQLNGNKIGNFIEKIKREYSSEKVTVEKAKEYERNIQKNFQQMLNEFCVDSENIINKCIAEEACKYIEEYNSYVQNLLGESLGANVKAEVILGNLATMKGYDMNLDDFEFDVREKVGTYVEEETRTRTKMCKEERIGTRKKKGLGAAIARGAGKLFKKENWGMEVYIYTEDVPYEEEYKVNVEKDKFENRRYVNLKKWVDVFFKPKVENLRHKSRDIIANEVKEQENALKRQFKKSFDKLDSKIKQKLSEIKETVRNKESLEKEVEKSKRNLDWLNVFLDRLNNMFKA